MSQYPPILRLLLFQISSMISENHCKLQRSGLSKAATICIGWLTPHHSRVFYPKAVDPETCKLPACISRPKAVLRIRD